MKKGFTLVELVIVILVIGILATMAIPKFADLQTSARTSTAKYTVGCVQEGVSHYIAESALTGRTPQWPATLDSAANGQASSGNPFFTNVLDQPITDSRWSKSPGTPIIYKYSLPDQDKAGWFFVYYPATGKVGNLEEDWLVHGM